MRITYSSKAAGQSWLEAAPVEDRHGPLRDGDDKPEACAVDRINDHIAFSPFCGLTLAHPAQGKPYA